MEEKTLRVILPQEGLKHQLSVVMSQVTKVKQIKVLFHAGEHSPALTLGWKNLLLGTAKGCFRNAVNSGGCGAGDAVCL